MSCHLGGDFLLFGRGECEINEQMEWCPEGDTHGVSELITHSH
jgi:hypothetical protein